MMVPSPGAPKEKTLVAFYLRMPLELRVQLEALAERDCQKMTVVILRGLVELLEREKLWPPRREGQSAPALPF